MYTKNTSKRNWNCVVDEQQYKIVGNDSKLSGMTANGREQQLSDIKKL